MNNVFYVIRKHLPNLNDVTRGGGYFCITAQTIAYNIIDKHF